MAEWIAAGYAEADFWASTLRIQSIYIQAARIKADREHRLRAWHAWHVAALSRASKLPALSDLTGERKAPKRQTWQEQRSNLRLILAATRGTVTKRKRPGDGS